jgi:hypothetical protein
MVLHSETEARVRFQASNLRLDSLKLSLKFFDFLARRSRQFSLLSWHPAPQACGNAGFAQKRSKAYRLTTRRCCAPDSFTYWA